MPQNKDFFLHSFFRHLGKDGLMFYLNETQHSLKNKIQSIFQEHRKKSESFILQEWIVPLFESSENQKITQDLNAFKHINELSHPHGFHALRSECFYNQLEHLLQEYQTPHALALYMYLKHEDLFKNAEFVSYIDQTPNWKLYAGIKKSTLKPWNEQKESFYDDIKDKFRKHLHNMVNLKVEAYDFNDRFILDIKTEGDYKQQEVFNKQGELEVETFRPSIEFAILYYKENGFLKVKTPQYQAVLTDALHQSFAIILLENPLHLMTLKDVRVVNLEQAKQFLKLDFPEGLKHEFSKAIVTSIKFKETSREGDSSNTIAFHNKQHLHRELQNKKWDLSKTEVLSISIQFQYRHNHRFRSKTITLVQKTNKTSTNTTELCLEIEKILIYWSFMNI